MKHKLTNLLNKIDRGIHSLTFRIWSMVVFFCCLCIIVLDSYTQYRLQSEFLEQYKSDLQLKASTLSVEMSQYADKLSDSMGVINKAFEYYSEVYDARMMLVDADFVIRLDTYAYEKNKTIISSNVLKAVATGTSSNSYDSATKSIEIASPVKGNDGKVYCVVVLDRSLNDLVGFNDGVRDSHVVRVTMIVLVMLAGVFVAKLIVKPINRLIHKVHETNMGYYDGNASSGQYTELEELAEVFNDTMSKIQKEEESRKEFVSNVSHELKTPITSMKVLADSLNGQENVPAELYKEFMQDIVDEIDRESKIIDDLLSLVRLDRNNPVVNISSVNINDLLELILKRLRPIAAKKNVELVLESFRPVVAEVDEVKITLAISNLVENAIKYNKEEGWVHVSLNADYQYFYVRVEDSGIGIPKESQQWVFDRFYRVDKARSRQSGGTGLGLAIVKSCITMHHGDIKLHSEEDTGTVFTVRIPINYISNKDE
ncbi:MAG: sensor histidine kinase [Lachnospiraceae bacterium]